MAQNPRQAAEIRLIEKAWKDEAFRNELRADPKGAVSRELGVQLPAGMKVQVVEESADTFVLVIPARSDAAPAGKLSDAELEQVAGGWDINTALCSLSCPPCNTLPGVCRG